MGNGIIELIREPDSQSNHYTFKIGELVVADPVWVNRDRGAVVYKSLSDRLSTISMAKPVEANAFASVKGPRREGKSFLESVEYYRIKD